MIWSQNIYFFKFIDQLFFTSKSNKLSSHINHKIKESYKTQKAQLFSDETVLETLSAVLRVVNVHVDSYVHSFNVENYLSMNRVHRDESYNVQLGNRNLTKFTT